VVIVQRADELLAEDDVEGERRKRLSLQKMFMVGRRFSNKGVLICREDFREDSGGENRRFSSSPGHPSL